MYLEQWYDPETKIKENETAESLAKEEVERLLKLRVICAMAAEIPRRLGADATNDELSTDKQRCRRIQHVASQVIFSYQRTGTTIPQIANVNAREAAQVKWEDWWSSHQIWLNNRLRYVATWGLSHVDNAKPAKSIAVRLNNELNWLAYAMR